MTKRKLFTSLIIYLTFGNLLRDLPVHCLRSQISGVWKFEYSEPQLVKSGHDKKCGHQEPDYDQLSWKAVDPAIDPTQYPKYYVKVELQKPNLVKILEDPFNLLTKREFHPFSDKLHYFNKNDTRWTMIYDEGFEVRIHGNKFFGFSQYYPIEAKEKETSPFKINLEYSQNMTVKTLENGKKYYTNCRETTTGWFHNEDTTVWACIKGTKIQDTYTDNQISYTGMTKVETKMKKVVYGYGSDNTNKITKDLRDVTHEKNEVKDTYRFKQGSFNKPNNIIKKNSVFDSEIVKNNLNQKISNLSKKSKENKLEEDLISEIDGTELNSINKYSNLRSSIDNPDEISNLLVSNDSDRKEFDKTFDSLNTDLNTSSDLDNALKLVQDDNTSFLQINSNFTDHKIVADNINNKLDKTWRAASYLQFKGKTVAELNKLAGTRHVGGFAASIPSDVSDLPRYFNKWVEEGYVNPPKNQGNCGSCYAMATLAMVEARLRIKYKSFYEAGTRLSVQHSMDCNYYNQGCDGGYPFLVSKFGAEFEYVNESCDPYREVNDTCSRCDVASQPEIYRNSDYMYVGGFYGNTSERYMMLEIMNHGPVVCSYEPPYDLFNYKAGVYQALEQADWLKSGMKRPEWSQVDHSNMCVGWGTHDDGTKYWIVQNTWGTDWGMNGYMWYKRGDDVGGIESIAVRADPYILRKDAAGNFKKIDPDYNVDNITVQGK